MEPVLSLYDTKKRRVLSSRQTAREIAPTISRFLSQGDGKASLTVDLADMATVTPSFFDELLHVIKDNMPSGSQDAPVIHLTNTSGSHSNRFRAVCRAHRMEMARIGPDHWRISQA